MGLKTTGAITVLEFAAECMRRGATVSQPIGDDSPYDLVIDNGHEMFRIQVRTAWKHSDGSGKYYISTCARTPAVSKKSGKASSVAKPFKVGDFDFFASKAGDYWYVIDVRQQMPTSGVCVWPDRESHRMKWNAGKDDWPAVGLPPSEPLTPDLGQYEL